MAGNIRGITIELNGDTTKLDKALRGVNKETRDVQNQLREVERALKMDPGNTELLAQKERLLGEEIDKTKEKLEMLRQADEQVSQEMAEGVEGAADKHNELQRQIATTEAKEKTLQREFDKLKDVPSKVEQVADKMAKLGTKVKDVGDKAKAAGKKMSQYVTAPLVGVGVAAAKVGMDFDSEMSKVSAISGATGDEFDSLREKAREMGSKTKFSAMEAGEGFEYMAMAGWKTEDMLAGIEPVLNLATASGEDLGATSDIVTDALTAFGLKATDAAHFADVLAQASSNANTNVGLMGETFKYAAPVAGALGYSAEDVALSIGLMANAGIKASQAGTSLRSLMSRMASPTKASAAAMEELGLTLENEDGTMKSFRQVMLEVRQAMSGMTETQKTQIASNLAGKNAMSGFLAIVNASDEDFNTLASSIDNCDGATQKMADTMMDNAKGGITTMMSALQNAAIAISDVLAPYITKAAEYITELANKFSALSPAAQKAIIVVGAIVAAIGPLLVIVGTVVGAIGSIMTFMPQIVAALGAVKGAIAAVGAALTGGLGLWLIVAAAAAAAVILIIKNWDKIKSFFIKLWASVKEIFAAGWAAIRSVASSAAQKAASVVKSVFSGLAKFMGKVWSAIKAGAKSSWNSIYKKITTPILLAVGIVKKAIGTIKRIINGAKFHLPKIKLPHFGIEGKFGLNPPSVPHFTVDWYKKAYNNPYLFTKPTVPGFGDGAGGELVYGKESLMRDIRSAVGEALTGIQMVGGSNQRDINIVLEMDSQVFAKAVYKANRDETQRVGVKLSGVYA